MDNKIIVKEFFNLLIKWTIVAAVIGVVTLILGYGSLVLTFFSEDVLIINIVHYLFAFLFNVFHHPFAIYSYVKTNEEFYLAIPNLLFLVWYIIIGVFCSLLNLKLQLDKLYKPLNCIDH